MKKIVFQTIIAAIGMLLVLCLPATAQTIQIKGGSCVVDTVVEIPSGSVAKFIRVDFKYTFDENATMSALIPLMKEGQFVVGKKKYQPNGISMDEKLMKNEAEKEGIVSLTLQIPKGEDVEKIKYTFNKQTISLKQNKN
jgi:hypothetical protein